MFRIILTTLGCFILIILNQNCIGSGNNMGTSNKSTAKQESTLASGVNGGNGTPYGGKLTPGTYVRALTEQLCGSQIKNLGEIVVTEDSVTGTIMNTETCTSVDVNLDTRDLEFAEYSEGRIGYFDGIYTDTKIKSGNSGNSGSSENTQVIKHDGIDEVWCRKEGSAANVGFDIVIKADYKKGEFTSIAASATMGTDGLITEQQYQPLVVDRRFDDMDRVRYRANNFELEIRQRSFNKGSGLMEGDLTYHLNGMATDMRINCRLGGELDVMIPKK